MSFWQTSVPGHVPPQRYGGEFGLRDGAEKSAGLRSAGADLSYSYLGLPRFGAVLSKSLETTHGC